jgi:hypothetical protein
MKKNNTWKNIPKDERQRLACIFESLAYHFAKLEAKAEGEISEYRPLRISMEMMVKELKR